MIEFHCPLCDEPMEIRNEMAGRRVRCIACDELIDVPQRSRRRLRSADLSADDDGLSGTEWLLYTLALVFVPAVNIVASGVLYYVWRDSRPSASKQINWLGFGIFLVHVLVLVLIWALVSNLR